MGEAVRVVVVGSDTGVGKTYVSCALVARWHAVGVDAVGLKPVESGVVGGRAADAAALGRACGVTVDPLWSFEPAVSPHLAARWCGVTIDVGGVARWVGQHARAVTLVETAGGLMTPLGEGRTNVDVVAALAPARVVLVVTNRLGALHHALCCMAILEGRGVSAERVVVVLNGGIDDEVASSNPRELAMLLPNSRVERVMAGGGAALPELASHLLGDE